MNLRVAAAAVAALFFFAVAGIAHAQDGMSYWLSPRMGGRPAEIAYDGRFYDKQGVDRTGDTLRMMRNTLDLSIPLGPAAPAQMADEGAHGGPEAAREGQGPADEWTLGLGFDSMTLGTDALLPDVRQPLPDGFYDPSVSLTYRRRTAGGQVWGGTVTIHSPSDDPFHTEDEWAVNATGFARLPRGKHDAWVLMANVSNTRDFAPAIPLPGAGYLYEKGRDTFMVGVPFSFARWSPVDGVTLSGFYRFPRTVHAEAAYRIADGLDVYAGFDWSHSAWFRADRGDDDERLFYYEKRAAAGVRWDVAEQVDVDVSGGWAFDRLFFEGDDWDDRTDDRLDIDDGPFMMLRVRIRL
jgi:hypothetical protein